jgi:phage shock protein PspC (stress-responsive transcriptional regulator)
MNASKRLFRHPADGRLGGVCAGIADYLETDVTLIRLLWVILSIVPGGFVGGIIAYAAAWIIIPEADTPALDTSGRRRLTRSLHDRKIAGVCGGLAEYFDLDPTVVRVAWAVLTVVPGGIVLGVVAYLVGWFIMPTQHLPAAAHASSTV